MSCIDTTILFTIIYVIFIIITYAGIFTYFIILNINTLYTLTFHVIVVVIVIDTNTAATRRSADAVIATHAVITANTLNFVMICSHFILLLLILCLIKEST